MGEIALKIQIVLLVYPSSLASEQPTITARGFLLGICSSGVIFHGVFHGAFGANSIKNVPSVH